AGATTPGGSPDYRGDAISVTGDSASGVPVSSVSALNGLRSERVVSQVVSSPVAATGSSTFQGAADNSAATPWDAGFGLDNTGASAQPRARVDAGSVVARPASPDIPVSVGLQGGQLSAAQGAAYLVGASQTFPGSVAVDFLPSGSSGGGSSTGPGP